jgi:hypothetical protein
MSDRDRHGPPRPLLWLLGGAITALLIGSSVLQDFGVRESFGQSKKNTKAKKPADHPPPVPKRLVTIAKIDLNTRPQALASAAKIDKFVEANYAKHKVEPNPLISDEQFVRRIYLDITGRIPTYRQVKVFLNTTDKEKRARLIDSLLSTDDYASNFYNFWADILRLNERLSNNAPGRPYNEWVRICLETNKPYDKWVYEMLAAEGKLLENPGTGYIIRDSGMPLDAMNNTVRIFLGTQIGCAQCHNHPFDRWMQKEFYEMAAFTFGTQTRRGAGDKKFGGGNVINKLRDDLKKADDKFDGGGKYNRFLQGNLVEVFDTKAKLTLPHDYQYDDGKPKSVVEPLAIFDPPAVIKKDESPRIAFARWLTSKDNPRFTKTIANRLWKKVFGIGQIEPVDDLKDETVAENPALMSFLESEMIRVKYDVKEYLRIVFNTKAYQREATHAEINAADAYHFPGPVLRRMTAEQVWDSFITLAVHNPDEYQIEPAKVQAKLLDLDLAQATAAEIMKRDEELRDATSGKARDARNKNYTYKGQLLVRASELPQPLPPSHFLRQFGQSDRESIEGSSRDGSVPQVLQMFNGPITHMLLEEKSLMYENVTSEKAPGDRMDVIFLAILSRRATPDERKAALEEIKAHDMAGYGNVVWALVNTREFLFLQ